MWSTSEVGKRSDQFLNRQKKVATLSLHRPNWSILELMKKSDHVLLAHAEFLFLKQFFSLKQRKPKISHILRQNCAFSHKNNV